MRKTLLKALLVFEVRILTFSLTVHCLSLSCLLYRSQSLSVCLSSVVVAWQKVAIYRQTLQVYDGVVKMSIVTFSQNGGGFSSVVSRGTILIFVHFVLI